MSALLVRQSSSLMRMKRSAWGVAEKERPCMLWYCPGCVFISTAPLLPPYTDSVIIPMSVCLWAYTWPRALSSTVCVGTCLSGRGAVHVLAGFEDRKVCSFLLGGLGLFFSYLHTGCLRSLFLHACTSSRVRTSVYASRCTE